MANKPKKKPNKQAPPISDYGLIGDCHSCALISKSASIDWCCMPRIDSASCFGRLLGWEVGGYCQISPKHAYESKHYYLPDTMILVTHFTTKTGEVKIFDFMPMKRGGAYQPYQQIIRIIEGVSGKVDLNVKIVPRFDYGAIKPWLKPYKKSTFIALGGCNGLLISSDFNLTLEDHDSLYTTFKTTEKQRYYLSILYRAPEDLDSFAVEVPSVFELDFRLDETTIWWQTWMKQGRFKGPYSEHMKRSALVLKSLQTAPTGAIAAAATTSLPESLGGARNWDYRFSWIRDSYFSVRSLATLGFINEADGFRRFIERSSHSCPDGLQTLFGVYGERRLHEYVIEELDGYQGSKPVRVGNEAATQLQLDMFGLLVDLTWIWHKKGISPDKNYWIFLEHIVNFTIENWRKPDHGIWEMRGEKRHFVHSKMSCWVAIDRGIKIARELKYEVDFDKWIAERDEIKREIEEKGYDPKRGVFIQAYDCPEMDAALLLLPIFGFVDYYDERFIRTLNEIRRELEIDGLIRRYGRHNDKLKGDEGTFLACTFWLITCLARQNQAVEANKLFRNAITTANDLYLFSEEYEATHKIMLGNFPQGFTHLSLILAAIALYEAEQEEHYHTSKY